MSIVASMAAQRAIMNANQAELAAIRANQAQQDLIGARGNFNDIARKESQIEAAKEHAKTKAQVARAQQKALKQSRHKIDYMA